MGSPHFLAKMLLETGAGSTLSDTRIRLLEEIDRLGSINRAAKAVPLSYKAAWEAVDTLNNLSPQPLVERVSGGRQGGGTRLTQYGRRLVAMYRALESEYQALLDRVAAQFDAADDVPAFRGLIRRLGARTSARNQFAGKVVSLHDDGVDVQVRLALDETTQIVAVITRTSVENLGLQVGSAAVALVKAPAVMLGTDAALATSAGNQLWGTVSRVLEGDVNNEVTLDLPSGRTITAVVTHESSRVLGLAPGKAACAVFQASSVLISVYP